ncbi:MAG TPA: GNAT family N-acetyltransferase [Myxococcota bacterium]|nr:GNAT family N-acetyltransferase [Myxococcota bacterium]
MATAPDARTRSVPIRVRALRARDREAALGRLRASARDDLFLMDLVRQIGAPSTADVEAEVLAAWRGDRLAGLAALRPTVVIESSPDPGALEALLGPLSNIGTGLVRSAVDRVDPLWARLAQRGRRALVDRTEASLVLEVGAEPTPDARGGARVRPAVASDLEPLVEAARASLREEGRPDPFLGDPRGFRRWVGARLARALVAEREGRVAWVGYADVRLREGWLLQGIYTWPDARRRGLAAQGVRALCRAAFQAGADHVQLSVVDGNEPALALYAKLGFRPHATLRTLLFA